MGLLSIVFRRNIKYILDREDVRWSTLRDFVINMHKRENSVCVVNIYRCGCLYKYTIALRVTKMLTEFQESSKFALVYVHSGCDRLTI